MLVMGPLQSWIFLSLLLAAVAMGTYLLAQASNWFRGIIAPGLVTLNCQDETHLDCTHAGTCRCQCHTD